MKRRNLLLPLFAWLFSLPMVAQEPGDSVQTKVLFETSMGNITIALSNLTPLHRDNFIRLVKEKKYDGLLFHRVIKDFMVQTGDLTTRLEPTPPPAPAKRNTRTPAKTQKAEPPLQTIPAEICYPALFHKRGAVAAARESDEKNPEHRSSPSQFYIIYGWDMNKPTAEYYIHQFDSVFNGKYKSTPEVIDTYAEKGGTPYLDGLYTVFGEVVEGMDVVARMQAVETDDANKPKEDIRVIRATIKEEE
ncbi:MAG: peptidylprolyl isomerase [Prevotella sp.]|nr:peptidylprolyl isomerase [Prevotella sp.]